VCGLGCLSILYLDILLSYYVTHSTALFPALTLSLNTLQNIRTGLFSATQTKELKELARAGMRNPVKVTVQVTRKALNPPVEGAAGTGVAPVNEVKGKTVQQATPSSLENNFMICPFDERPLQLSLFIMRNLRSKIIVFCSTCACVDYYSEIFSKMTKTAAGQKKTKAVPKVSTGSEGEEEGEGEGGKKKSVAVPSASSSYLPSCINTLGFHGKMVPKKRALLYKKFQSLSSGVLFCTDIAARGIDFPDIDFIVQLSAPKGRVLCSLLDF
jgi:ATP-dependent RNA helicase DDX55/SPB4